MPFTALPESTASISARRLASARTRFAQASRHLARSLMPTLRHSAKPLAAALTARSTSFASAWGASPSLVPVAGLCEAKLRPLVASCQAPP